MERFREIKEVVEIKDKNTNKPDDGYLKIKPETTMTINEAKSFFDNMFSDDECEE